MSAPLLPRSLHGTVCFPKHFVEGQRTVGVHQSSVEGVGVETGSAVSSLSSLPGQLRLARQSSLPTPAELPARLRIVCSTPW